MGHFRGLKFAVGPNRLAGTCMGFWGNIKVDSVAEMMSNSENQMPSAVECAEVVPSREESDT